MEEIVLGLLGDRRVEVVFVADGEGLGELGGGPFAGAPVEDFALNDEIVHRAAGFGDGRGGIGAVAVVEVEVVNLEALEGVVAGFDEVFAREAGLVGLVVFPAEKGFAGNDVAAAAPAAFLEDVAHHELGLAVGVGLGVVEEIDARVVGGVEEFLGDGVADLFAEGDPGAEGQRADLKTGATKGAVEHCHGAATMNDRCPMSNDE